MNIFYVDKSPQLAAQALCDKHVVKMILETAQLLSSNIPETLRDTLPKPLVFYKKTHYNHPCTIWTRTSEENFNWVIAHGLALAGEYQFRYGKIHKSLSVILSVVQATKLITFPSKQFTSPALAMPDEYKTSDPVESYRNYYKLHKLTTIQCNWTKRERPQWLK
jgi:hypothetical protein